MALQLAPNRLPKLMQYLTTRHLFLFQLKDKIGYDAITRLPKHPSIAFYGKEDHGRNASNESSTLSV
jgi:hypothetical protein